MRVSSCVAIALFAVVLASCNRDETSLTTPVTSQPVIDSVAPSWGAAGTQVTVYGTDFATDSPSVTFSGTPATSVAPQSPTRLFAVVPGTAPAGLVAVSVSNPDGGSGTLNDAFEIVIPPRLDSIAPRHGTVGTEVRLYGVNFLPDSVRVFFGDVEAARVLSEVGSLFAIAPEGLPSDGVFDVRVVNRNMAADTLVGSFTVVAPDVIRINGVTKPTGLRGMTVIMDGDAFGDSLAISNGKIYFSDANGLPVEALVADTANDWTNTFAVTTVPASTADTSWVWVETTTGVSDSVQFLITQAGNFSPSVIDWTPTTSLPQPLQGLGAAFIPIEEGPAPANHVMTVGGADTLNVATDVVYRATVAQSGELGPSWSTMTPLPEKRAYHTTAAATAFTAALDTTTTGAYLYAIGGVDETGAAVNTVYYAHVDLQGEVGAWMATTPLPDALHSAKAVLFRGYLYLLGGADTANAAVSDFLRIKINADGTLGDTWDPLPSLVEPSAYASVMSFGPYVYIVGGETGTSAPVTSTSSGTASAAAHFARINVRTAGLTVDGWTTTELMAKVRSKHSGIFGGGSLLVTSGIYLGDPGSSENTFANLLSDGSVQPWQGATGADIIAGELGYSLYNQAAITFIDQSGKGHVLVLGGADRDAEGVPSAGVVFY